MSKALNFPFPEAVKEIKPAEVESFTETSSDCDNCMETVTDADSELLCSVYSVVAHISPFSIVTSLESIVFATLIYVTIRLRRATVELVSERECIMVLDLTAPYPFYNLVIKMLEEPAENSYPGNFSL
ncbi:hypothetical protein ACTXT7_012968 [Hymenolepis weldensis]